MNWSESPLPILGCFVAALALVGYYELGAVRAQERVRVVLVAANEEEGGFERQDVELLTGKDPAVEEALEKARAGDFPGARQALSSLLAADDRRVSAWVALGGLELRRGEPVAAIAALERAARLAPTDPVVRYDLAVALERAGRSGEAEASYREALRRGPNMSAPRLNLAGLLLDGGRAPEAAAVLEASVPLVAAGPVRGRVLTRLGLAWRRAGDTAKAGAAYDQAILHDPRSTAPRLGRARVLLEQGQAGEAAAEIDRVIAIDPSSATGHFLRGLLAARRGATEEARRDYAEAVRLRPSSREARFNLGRAELSLGNVPAAEAIFEALHAERPDDPEVLFHLGRIAYRDDRHADAAERYRAAMAARAGRYPEAALNLGLALRAAGDRAGAEAAYRSALAMRPEYPEAMFNLAMLHGSTLGGLEPDLETADGWLVKAVAADPGYAAAWFNRGVIAARRKRRPEAEAAYRKAIAVRPDYVDAHLNLAAVLARSGRFAEAVEENRAVIRLEPRNAKAWFNLGRAYNGLEQRAQAAAAYRRAVELDPGYTAAWLNLGVVLADGGDPAAAVEVYREALDLEAGNVKLRFNLALQYRKLDRLESAESELRRAVRLDPAYRRAWRLLADVVERRAGKAAAEQVRIAAANAGRIAPAGAPEDAHAANAADAADAPEISEDP